MNQHLVPLSTSHRITLKKAIEMTTLYREATVEILKPEYIGKDIFAICETFNKEQIIAYLSKPECAGFRIYYGMDLQLKIHAIIIGVDSEGKDILPALKEQDGDDDNNGEIFEDALRCPQYCPEPSPLNG